MKSWNGEITWNRSISGRTYTRMIDITVLRGYRGTQWFRRLFAGSVWPVQIWGVATAERAFARNIWISKRAAYSEDIENPRAGRVEVTEMAKRLFLDARKERERGKDERYVKEHGDLVNERISGKKTLESEEFSTMPKKTLPKSMIIRRTIWRYLREIQILTRSAKRLFSA